MKRALTRTASVVFVTWMAGVLLPFSTCGQSPADQGASTASVSTAKAASPSQRNSIYRPLALTPRAIEHYQTVWGVDSFVVRTVESGQMIRFSYRVVDAAKAAAVNDKKATPFLIDEGAHVKLVVPMMEKVGQLRQSSTPEAGKSYWMVFSNKGGFVKHGDRVNVEIGKFRVEGLVVQ